MPDAVCLGKNIRQYYNSVFYSMIFFKLILYTYNTVYKRVKQNIISLNVGNRCNRY